VFLDVIFHFYVKQHHFQTKIKRIIVLTWLLDLHCISYIVYLTL